MGDAMADWLAYGLEDAYAEKPDIGIVRKHRTDSGLIRYDPRRDNVDWAQTIRETVAAEKPQIIVMMVGNNDRQSIREKAPVVVRQAPGAAKPSRSRQQTITPDTKPPLDAELQRPETPEPPVPTTEQARIAAYGPWEFQIREVGSRLHQARRCHHGGAEEFRACRCFGSACRRAASPRRRTTRPI